MANADKYLVPVEGDEEETQQSERRADVVIKLAPNTMLPNVRVTDVFRGTSGYGEYIGIRLVLQDGTEAVTFVNENTVAWRDVMEKLAVEAVNDDGETVLTLNPRFQGKRVNIIKKKVMTKRGAFMHRLYFKLCEPDDDQQVIASPSVKNANVVEDAPAGGANGNNAKPSQDEQIQQLLAEAAARNDPPTVVASQLKQQFGLPIERIKKLIGDYALMQMEQQ